jgi:hypothetical protein
VSYHKEHHGISRALIDRSANGGVTGSDVRVILKTNRTVAIRGIDNHHCTNIKIGTDGGVIRTHKGPVIGIFNQHALLNIGSSIHSPCQLEWYKNDINDKSVLSQEVSSVFKHLMLTLFPLVFKMASPVLKYAHILIKNLKHCHIS